ncbi:MAG: hypothetical protein QF805_20725, partial [Pirellulaceae bacterium]|nr:hypothetical protein [Pirellulaceae bacterium]
MSRILDCPRRTSYQKRIIEIRSGDATADDGCSRSEIVGTRWRGATCVGRWLQPQRNRWNAMARGDAGME